MFSISLIVTLIVVLGPGTCLPSFTRVACFRPVTTHVQLVVDMVGVPQEQSRTTVIERRACMRFDVPDGSLQGCTLWWVKLVGVRWYRHAELRIATIWRCLLRKRRHVWRCTRPLRCTPAQSAYRYHADRFLTPIPTHRIQLPRLAAWRPTATQPRRGSLRCRCQKSRQITSRVALWPSLPRTRGGSSR